MTEKNLKSLRKYVEAKPYGLKSKDEELLREGMRLYTERYGIDYECDSKDILTNQTTEVKRLIKCINR